MLSSGVYWEKTNIAYSGVILLLIHFLTKYSQVLNMKVQFHIFNKFLFTAKTNDQPSVCDSLNLLYGADTCESA